MAHLATRVLGCPGSSLRASTAGAIRQGGSCSTRAPNQALATNRRLAAAGRDSPGTTDRSGSWALPSMARRLDKGNLQKDRFQGPLAACRFSEVDMACRYRQRALDRTLVCPLD